MDLKEARQIVSACLDSKYSLMGIGDYEEYVPLPKVSLEKMLEANRIVSESESERNEDGSQSMYITIDPRGVAAMYVREMYRHSPEDALEAMGWNLIQSDR